MTSRSFWISSTTMVASETKFSGRSRKATFTMELTMTEHGLGRDVNFDNYVARHLFVQNIAYLAREFRVNGFRFDSLGQSTMNRMGIFESAEVDRSLQAVNRDHRRRLTGAET